MTPSENISPAPVDTSYEALHLPQGAPGELLPGESLLRYRRIAIAVGDGAPLSVSKTAISLLRYRTADIVAVIDCENQGETTQQRYGVGGDIPIVGDMDAAGAIDSIFIGISPAGGKMPASLHRLICRGVEKGIDIVSGLHDFVSQDLEISRSAAASGSRLIDVRRNSFSEVAKAKEFRPGCLRIHTVGHDCSVGKMVTSLEVQRDLQQRGHDAQFLATGQTGIMIGGTGIPADCVVSDFLNGTVENFVLQHQDHDILLIEGQGSITHPSFSAVTLGLLHGCAPHGLILCYEAGRTHVKGLPHRPLASLERYRELYEQLGSERHPVQVIGIGINSRNLAREEAMREKDEVEQRLGLPACDVYRDGPRVLSEAVLTLASKLQSGGVFA